MKRHKKTRAGEETSQGKYGYYANKEDYIDGILEGLGSAASGGD